jgi:hypothetical protein
MCHGGSSCPFGPSSSKKCLDLCALEHLLLTCQAYVSRTTPPPPSVRPSLLPYSAAVAAARTAVPPAPSSRDACMRRIASAVDIEIEQDKLPKGIDFVAS